MPPVEQKISSLAGRLAPADILINLSQLLDQYYSIQPDPSNPLQKVSFGTSGHRGSAANGTFNEDHILAISQAVAECRANQGINGPLYMGRGVDLFVTVNIIIRLFFSKWNYILWQFNFFDIRLCQNIPTVIK